MKLINIGFSNTVNQDKVVGVVGTEAAPIKRIISEAKTRGYLIDATGGRKTKSVIIMDSYHLILSGLQVETIVNRMNENLKEV